MTIFPKFDKEYFNEKIKESLKENLKVCTYIQFPCAFNDGYVKTDVYFDDEIISTHKQNIRSGSTMLSF